MATITEVRAKLVEQQKKWEMIKELSWMVEIGTVVFPNAENIYDCKRNYQSKGVTMN
jgi:cytidylate kinase